MTAERPAKSYSAALETDGEGPKAPDSGRYGGFHGAPNCWMVYFMDDIGILMHKKVNCESPIEYHLLCITCITLAPIGVSPIGFWHFFWDFFLGFLLICPTDEHLMKKLESLQT